MFLLLSTYKTNICFIFFCDDQSEIATLLYRIMNLVSNGWIPRFYTDFIFSCEWIRAICCIVESYAIKSFHS